MLELSESNLIGRGWHRECYVHSDDDNLCVKVVFSNGGEMETLREQSYYRFLEQRGVSWDILPKFYGNVDTNRGRGAVFELVRDYDGAISKSLEHYLSTPELMHLHGKGLQQAFIHLKKTLLSEKIVTMTLHPKNIFYKRTSEHEGVLVIIDNIGNSEFIPLANYFDFWAEMKISRRWKRFVDRVQEMFLDDDSLDYILCGVK